MGLGLAGVCWGGANLAANLRKPADVSNARVREPDTASRALAADAHPFLAAEGLATVRLGMDVASLGGVRPLIRRKPSADGDGVGTGAPGGASGEGEPSALGRKVFVEALGPGRSAVYLFDARSAQLVSVQVASGLGDAEALMARLKARDASFGAPDGIWDCGLEGGEGLPTRRFTWGQGEASAMDTIHVLPRQVLATLYVASQAAIVESLRRGGCTPTAKADFESFPSITPSAADPK